MMTRFVFIITLLIVMLISLSSSVLINKKKEDSSDVDGSTAHDSKDSSRFYYPSEVRKNVARRMFLYSLAPPFFFLSLFPTQKYRVFPLQFSSHTNTAYDTNCKSSNVIGKCR